jgi:hypothetical protein
MIVNAPGGNLFSLAFGRNLDKHDPTLGNPSGNSTLSLLSTISSSSSNTSISSISSNSSIVSAKVLRLLHRLVLRAAEGDDDERRHRCVQGKQCYVDTLHLAVIGCVLAVGLAVYAGWRDVKTRARTSH